LVGAAWWGERGVSIPFSVERGLSEMHVRCVRDAYT
jgi:hypothetical protein